MIGIIRPTHYSSDIYIFQEVYKKQEEDPYTGKQIYCTNCSCRLVEKQFERWRVVEVKIQAGLTDEHEHGEYHGNVEVEAKMTDKFTQEFTLTVSTETAGI